MPRFRSAHGKARELGALTASECPPVDELRPGSGGGPGPIARGSDGTFARGNGGYAAAQTGVPKGGLRGLALRAKDPAWLAARRLGRQAAVRRIAEVAQAHGGELSSGVCQLIRDAADLSADATYLRARAAADDNPDLLKTAAQLSAGARQSQRDAWALAQLEAASRPKRPGPHVPAWMAGDEPAPLPGEVESPMARVAREAREKAAAKKDPDP